MSKFKTGDKIRVVKVEPLEGNEIAPPLKMGDEHTVGQICEDSKGNQHLDVGLVSSVSFVRSWETKEELPNGDKIHWCHPSRFEHV